MQETTDPILSPEQAQEFEEQIKDNRCRWCDVSLEGVDISYYPQIGLQWLYKICPKCGYQWALWKLGVPR